MGAIPIFQAVRRRGAATGRAEREQLYGWVQGPAPDPPFRKEDLMSEGYDREEELRRRRVEEQRPLGPDIDAQGRKTGDPRENERRYRDREVRIKRGSR